jgi:hypothetical protein
MISYSESCRDPNLFGPWFAEESWGTWRVLDKALFGEPLDEAELATFKALTGRDETPEQPVSEAWLICGRRSGKDVKAASIAAYLATIGEEIFNFRQFLTRGERGVVQLLAVDRDQARVCLGYLRAMLEQPLLEQMVSNAVADGIELTNGLGIEITTNNQRRVRGRTVIAAVFDEVAFWGSENSVSPDEDVYRAVLPAMATIPNAMLIGISSPHARKGLLYRQYRKHYGKPGKVLIVQAPTWVMNPTLPRDGEFLSQAFEDDPASAAAEYGAQFRTDIEAFVTREVVEACVTSGARERPRVSNASYRAFVDPSGGSNDSMTLAIAHPDGDKAVLDAIRERKPPFSPESVVEEFCTLLKSYGISEVTGDRYAGEWPRERFRAHGIAYRLAEKPRSDLYRDMLPVLNSGKADLLDNDRMVNQLVGLERRVARGGRESIDHAPNGHDDIANAVAGAISLCAKKAEQPMAVFGTYGRMDKNPFHRAYRSQ